MIKFSLFTLVILHVITMYASGGETGKDTTNAIDRANLEYSNEIALDKMSKKKVVALIDSLFELESIPYELIDAINNYTERKRLRNQLHVKLTNFYDTSIYPSNSMYYNMWDTYQLHPYTEALRLNDKKVKLVIQDLASSCEFVPPVKGIVTSNYGWRNGRNHNGIDINLNVWDTVRVAFAGMVRIARYNSGGYGRVVIVRHYNGLETLYAHLHRLKVKAGDIVEAGDLIGLGGSSGHSTGSHLHFELRFKGKALNPKSIIDFKNNKLISDSIQLVKQKWSYSVIPMGLNYHIVSKGENLYRIALRYGTTINEICKMNRISRNRPLYVGQKLRIES